MKSSLEPSDTRRFGAFEVDFHSGERRKRGRKVKLQETPYPIIEILLEEPGRMVSREERAKRLWPDDTFVDFGLRVGDPLFQDVQGKEERARLRWIYEGQDRALIPTRGLRVLSNTRWFLDAPTATTDFGLSESRGSVFWSFAKTHRLAFVGAGGTSFNRPVPTLYDFTLGGPLRLTAYDDDEFRGDKFLLGSVAYLKQISRLPDFVGAAVYVTGLAEFGSAVGDDGAARFVFSLGRSFRYPDTPVETPSRAVLVTTA